MAGGGSVKLYVLSPSSDTISANLERTVLARLPERERDRASALGVKKRRDFVLGRLLLRHLVARELGCCQDDVDVDVAERGRLVITVGPSRTANVSLSHDHNHICAGLNPRGRIGVDIQGMVVVWETIARRFFTQEENGFLADLPRSRRPVAFASIWAAKESVCKARGTGLRFPLPSVGGHHEGRSGGLEYRTTFLDPCTALSVAWDGPYRAADRYDSPRVVEIGLNDIIEGDGHAR
jgi:phosphopantetheinyl transferase